MRDLYIKPAPDTDLEINSVPTANFPAGSTIDIQLTDGVNPVTPDDVTVVGNVVTVEVPKIDIEVVVNGVPEPPFQLNPYENNIININLV